MLKTDIFRKVAMYIAACMLLTGLFTCAVFAEGLTKGARVTCTDAGGRVYAGTITGTAFDKFYGLTLGGNANDIPASSVTSVVSTRQYKKITPSWSYSSLNYEIFLVNGNLTLAQYSTFTFDLKLDDGTELKGRNVAEKGGYVSVVVGGALGAGTVTGVSSSNISEAGWGMGDAALVEYNSTIDAYVAKGDYDMFKFNWPGGKFVCYSKGGLDLVADIVNAQGKTVYRGNNGAGDGKNFKIEINLPAGTYGISVRVMYHGSEGNYQLVLGNGAEHHYTETK